MIYIWPFWRQHGGRFSFPSVPSHRAGLVRRSLSSFSSDGEKNLYDLLQVSPNASMHQIKQAYFRLSKLHHPDRTGGSSEVFRKITDAYNVLSKKSSRLQYDQSLLTRTQAAAHGKIDLRDLSSRRRGTSGRFWRPADNQQKTATGHRGRSAGTQHSDHSFDDAQSPVFNRENMIKLSQFNHSRWIKSHYRHLFNRRLIMREFAKTYNDRFPSSEPLTHWQINLRNLTVTLFLFILFYVILDQ